MLCGHDWDKIPVKCIYANGFDLASRASEEGLKPPLYTTAVLHWLVSELPSSNTIAMNYPHILFFPFCFKFPVVILKILLVLLPPSLHRHLLFKPINDSITP